MTSAAAVRAAGAIAAAQRVVIADNAASLSFTRTVRRPIDGGWVIDPPLVHGPYVVRVYQEPVAAPTDDGLPAERQDQRGWCVLAGTDADLCGDPDVYDEADVPNLGLVRVVAVYPLRHGGALHGYRAQLDLVRPAEGDAFPNPTGPLPPVTPLLVPPAAPPAAPPAG